MFNMIAVGDRIHMRMRRLGITEKKLAAQIGTTDVSLSRWINGVRIPKLSVIAAIADALNTTIAYLVGETQEVEK